MDWANIVLATCGVVGLVVSVVTVAYGYGAFRGNTRAVAQQSKEATGRVFEHVKDLNVRLGDLEKLMIGPRLDRAERIGDDVRQVLIDAELMLPSATQTGRDGRGVPNPLLRRR